MVRLLSILEKRTLYASAACVYSVCGCVCVCVTCVCVCVCPEVRVCVCIVWCVVCVQYLQLKLALNSPHDRPPHWALCELGGAAALPVGVHVDNLREKERTELIGALSAQHNTTQHNASTTAVQHNTT